MPHSNCSPSLPFSLSPCLFPTREMTLKCALAALVTLIPAALSRAQPPDRDETPVEEPDDEDARNLPTIDKMELPSFERLMKGPAVDWIVMHNKKRIELEPVFPR